MATKKKNEPKLVIARGAKWRARDAAASTNENRHAGSAGKALYVMVSEEQKARYELAAKYAGMTMRDYVINALETAVAQQSSMTTDIVAGLGLHPNRESNVVAALQMFVAQGMRLGRVERALEALQKRVDLQWGPVEESFVAPENRTDDDER